VDRTRLLFVAVALSVVAPLGSGVSLRSTDAVPHSGADRSFPPQAVLRASDAEMGDTFGVSVAIRGNVAIVGAVYEDGGPGDPNASAGAAYIFLRNRTGASRWGQAKKLSASDTQSGDWFGRSVAVSGDFALVGAPEEDGGSGDPVPGAGAAYIFHRDQGGTSNWGEVQKLTAPDAQQGDGFGFSVAIDGDTAIIGANREDGGPGDPLDNAGVAYVFQNISGFGWLHVGTLRVSDTQTSDWFGESVAISGDVVIVGAKGEDGGIGDPLADAGAAYIYRRDQGGANGWGEVRKLVALDPASGDGFGYSVGIAGKLAVVGAYGEDGGPGDPLLDAGAAYVFEDLSGSGWTQVAKPTATDAEAGRGLGFSVAISAGVVLAGVLRDDGGPGDPLPYSGATYVFVRHLGGTNSWGQAGKIHAPDAASYDEFGNAVAISGKNAMVAAYLEDGGPGDPEAGAGAAYVFYVSLLEAFKAN
jgi:hypothetical protein